MTERQHDPAAGELVDPLSSPAAYFLPTLHDTIHQGDIILAPVVVAWSAASRPARPDVIAPFPGARLLAPWPSDQDLERPSDPLAPPPVTLEVAYRPAMVLSHECEIEKEFNEYVAGFESEGEDAVAQARREAETRWDLDRYVLISPLLEYRAEEAAEARWSAIRSGQKIGYFPVLSLPGAPPVPSFVHLSRIATVERRLLGHARTLASLTPAAVHLLRAKLAETFSVRNLSVISRLEAAIGHRIVDVKTVKQGRRSVTASLQLDDSSDVVVEVNAEPTLVRPERTRHPRS